MLFMILTFESKNYKFYIENGEYWVTYADNEYIHYLTEEEVKDLFKIVFSSQLNYSHQENGYEIYLDPVGNKRYFKDGKDDYILFFRNNGTSGIDYSGEITNNTNNDSLVKKIILEIRHVYKNSIFGAIILSLAIRTYSMPTYRQPSTFEIPIESIDLNEVSYLIKSSSCLTEEEKQFFYNIVFLADVLRTANPSRAEELRERFTELGILYFTPEELEDMSLADIIGYYNEINNNNKIHIRGIEYWDQAAAHEFIHLCQDPSCFSYICEASAEIMAKEYFGSPTASYYEARENLYYLLEIIGPKPVMECNFKGDTGSFENAIREYLSPEDFEELITEFCKKPKNANHKRIKQLLEKMAEKKFENYENPKLEKQEIEIRSNCRALNHGYYFNQQDKHFYRPIEAYATISEEYNREIDGEIEYLSYFKKIQANEIKEILDNEKYDNSNIEIYFANESKLKIINIEELKKNHPNDYYQEFNRILENGGEIETLMVHVKLFDQKEINAELENIEEGFLCYAQTANDFFDIRIVEGRKCLKIKSDFKEIPSIATIFPEQMEPHHSIQAPDEDAIFIPSR